MVAVVADGRVYSRKCQRRQLYVSFRDLDWQVGQRGDIVK